MRHHPTSWKITGASPLNSEDLDLYPQPLTNTRSPTPNSEEPLILGNVEAIAATTVGGAHAGATNNSIKATPRRVAQREVG